MLGWQNEEELSWKGIEACCGLAPSEAECAANSREEVSLLYSGNYGVLVLYTTFTSSYAAFMCSTHCGIKCNGRLACTRSKLLRSPLTDSIFILNWHSATWKRRVFSDLHQFLKPESKPLCSNFETTRRELYKTLLPLLLWLSKTMNFKRFLRCYETCLIRNFDKFNLLL